MRLAGVRRSLPASILSGMGGGYNKYMELVALVFGIIILVWVVSVASFVLYFWFRVMPVVRQLRETTEGQLTLSKLMFPPRFRR